MTTAVAAMPIAGPWLVDTSWIQVQLVEDKQKTGRLIARGVFGRVDVPTNNLRLYRKHIVKRELGRLAEALGDRSLYGELDHPADGRTKLDRVSHLITSLAIEGDEIIGEAEILDTDKGRNLKAIIAAGGKIGISSRGMGTTTNGPNGTKVVNEDFRLMTFDFVAEPAAPGAIPRFFNESTGQPETAHLSAEELKKTFPDQVRELELMAESRAHYEDAAKVLEAEGTAREKLREEFAAKLSVELDKVKQATKPTDVQTMEETTKKIVSAEARVREAEDKLSASLDEKDALKKALDESVALAKQLGYKLRLIDRLSKIDEVDRAEVDSLVGDPSVHESIVALDKVIDEAIGQIEARRAEEARQTRRAERLRRQQAELDGARQQTESKAVKVAERAKEAVAVLKTEKGELDDLRQVLEAREGEVVSFKTEVAETLTELRAEMKSLREERDDMRSKLHETARTAEVLGAQAHAAKRVASRSDAPRMRKVLKDLGAKSVEEVDSILENFKESVHAPDAEFERIRRHARKSRQVVTESDEHSKGGSGDDGGTMMGVPVVELQRLAGILGLED